ncbi:MAG: hypothetical protein P4L69_05920 [Desulfosporosinus sp.]|nr:hypothetical protein [Desulfosporosinus sp.]
MRELRLLLILNSCSNANEVFLILAVKKIEKVVKPIISIFIILSIGYLFEVLGKTKPLEVIEQSNWYPLCIAIWSAQILFSFFSSTLLTFLVDKSERKIYGLQINEVVTSIYTKFTFNLYDLMSLSIYLAILNLVFVIIGWLNMITVIFFSNALLMVIAYFLTIDCLVNYEKIEDSVVDYIYKLIKSDKLRYNNYFESLELYAYDCSKINKTEFDKQIRFINENLIFKFIDNNNVKLRINQSLIRIISKIVNDKEYIYTDFQDLYNIGLDTLKSLNIDNLFYSDMFIHYFIFAIDLKDLFKDEEIKSLLEICINSNFQKLIGIENHSTINDINNIFDDSIKKLTDTRYFISSNFLIDSFINIVRENKGKCFNNYNFLDSYIESTLEMKYKHFESDIIHKILDIYEYIVKNKKISDINNEIIDTHIKHYALKIANYYFAIMENRYLLPEEQDSLLSYIERIIISKYCEVDDFIYEIILLIIVKKFAENKKYRLKLILDKLVNKQLFSPVEREKINCIVAKLSYYFYYLIYEESFPQKHKSFIKESISKRLYPTHRSFILYLNNSNINIWKCYESYLNPVFAIEMEYVKQQIEYVAYKPYLINEWTKYFVLFSAFIIPWQYMYSADNKFLYDWKLLNENEFISLLEHFDKYGNLASNLEKERNLFVSLYLNNKELNNNSNFLFDQISNVYKQKAIEKVHGYFNKAVGDKIIDKYKLELEEKLNAMRRLDISCGIFDNFEYTIIESVGVLTGDIYSSYSEIDRVIHEIRESNIKFNYFKTKYDKILIDDNYSCKIERIINKDMYYVNITNDIYVKMTLHEVIEYLNKRYIKLIITLKFEEI